MPDFIIDVEVREIDEIDVAYVSHVGEYEDDSLLFEHLYEKLYHWAEPLNLINFPETKIITIYHNQDTQSNKSSRIDVCITIPKNIDVKGGIDKKTIKKSTYAISHFNISKNKYSDAWAALFDKWFIKSNYTLDSRPCFEMYFDDPKKNKNKKHLVDFYLPVKLK